VILITATDVGGHHACSTQDQSKVRMAPTVQESCVDKSPACTIYRKASGIQNDHVTSMINRGHEMCWSSHLKRSEICMELEQKWNA